VPPTTPTPGIKTATAHPDGFWAIVTRGWMSQRSSLTEARTSPSKWGDKPVDARTPRSYPFAMRPLRSLTAVVEGLSIVSMVACASRAQDDKSSSLGSTTVDPGPRIDDTADASFPPMNGAPFDSSASVATDGATSPGRPPSPDILVWEWDQSACPLLDRCGSNTSPVLGRPDFFVVNGVISPDLRNVRNGDQVQIVVAVEDTDCNLACGSIDTSHKSQQADGVGSQSLPSNVPCSTKDTGVYLGIDVGIPSVTSSDPNAFAGRVDSYAFTARVSDFCGASSASITVSFDVHF
jgi:hypothetical protein